MNQFYKRACCVTALVLCGCSSKGSDKPTVEKSSAPKTKPAVTKRPSVKSYTQKPAVQNVTLTAEGQVDSLPASVATSPDGKTWIAAHLGWIQVYKGDKKTAEHTIQSYAVQSAKFSADGTLILSGAWKYRVADGSRVDQPKLPDLPAWLEGKAPTPPKLSLLSAEYSDDQSILVVAATGRVRSRRHGLQRPKTGDEDWLLILDGQSLQPKRLLWHGKGRHKQLAISAEHIAAGGRKGVRVFSRKGTDAVELTSAPRAVRALAWSPDGTLLAALGMKNAIAVWKTGAWDAPVARWSLDAAYGNELAFHPTRPLLIAGDNEKNLHMWSVQESHLDAPKHVFKQKLAGDVGALAITPSGDVLIVAMDPPANKVQRYKLELKP